MDHTQISIDELLKSYQTEITTLFHNKIMLSIQVEKLNEYVKNLEADVAALNDQLNKLDKKTKVVEKTL